MLNLLYQKRANCFPEKPIKAVICRELFLGLTPWLVPAFVSLLSIRAYMRGDVYFDFREIADIAKYANMFPLFWGIAIYGSILLWSIRCHFSYDLSLRRFWNQNLIVWTGGLRACWFGAAVVLAQMQMSEPILSGLSARLLVLFLLGIAIAMIVLFGFNNLYGQTR